jgi:hypothetical protein
MAQAAAVRPTTMAAVLGGTVDEDELAAAGLEVATINVPARSSSADRSTRSRPGRRPPGAGSGRSTSPAPSTPRPWHRRRRLPRARRGDDSSDAVCDVVANGDGAVLRDARELMSRLVGRSPGRCASNLACRPSPGKGGGGTTAVRARRRRRLAGMGQAHRHRVTPVTTPADLRPRDVDVDA